MKKSHFGIQVNDSFELQSLPVIESIEQQENPRIGGIINDTAAFTNNVEESKVQLQKIDNLSYSSQIAQ